ncbi:Inositol 2-dehydrogenase/D-chiro-inositol 3-dehydrogenase [subsurface metagenome]
MINEKEQTQKSEEKTGQEKKASISRRTIIKALAGLPVLGVFVYKVIEKVSFDNNKNLEILKELGLNNIEAPKIIKSGTGKKGDLIRVGIIGFGNRANTLARGLGFIHPEDAEDKKKGDTLNDWLSQDNLNVALTGICDVFDMHAFRGMTTARNELHPGGGSGVNLSVKRYRHYHEMLESDDIDAVVIATPDHHHAQITIDAVQAGKHVYCEKSFIRAEEELYRAYDVVKNSDRVFQLGHQISKNVIFQKAKDIIDKNILGKISLIETTSNRNTASGAWIRHLDVNGNLKPGDEKTIDWDQWLGSRPKVPFSIDRYYNWTKWFDYSTGLIGQLFTHEYDAVNQLLGIGIPKSVVSIGGIYYWKDNREIPDVLECVFDYPDRDLILTYSASLANSRRRGRVFMGHDASMEFGSTLSITPDNDSTRYKKKLSEGIIDSSRPMLLISSGSDKIDAVTSATQEYYASRGLTDTYVNGRPVDITYLHIKEWVDCIRNGGEPTANIERTFEEGVASMMAHKSYIEKRRVEWDPVKRKIV